MAQKHTLVDHAIDLEEVRIIVDIQDPVNVPGIRRSFQRIPYEHLGAAQYFQRSEILLIPGDSSRKAGIRGIKQACLKDCHESFDGGAVLPAFVH